MATRNRTILFLQYRNSLSRPTKSTHVTAPNASTVSLEEQAGLMESSDHVIELSILPPRWVDIVDEVNDDIKGIESDITQLDQMHAKHLLPGFDDSTSDEIAIERLTDAITRQFHTTQNKIKRIFQEARSVPGASANEDALARNVQMALASRLQDVSSRFRKKQSAYMQRMRGRVSRNKDYLSFTESGGDTSEMLLEDEEGHEDGFTQSQLELVESSNQAITQRSHEIEQIAKSISEVAEIFRELQTMVIDQGTLLDRIDYNVEMVSTHVKEASKELDQGALYQKRARKRQIMLLLILLIIGLIIVLLFKPRR
ncbi:uncharacterized protein VTP21DRAFT_3690 [Calcarisporiella thermophila]|uniref:uncharacterized protein n=1 Tax=Calcarisporiella thermophila TaxID=911321 RepID=UPI0037423C1B